MKSLKYQREAIEEAIMEWAAQEMEQMDKFKRGEGNERALLECRQILEALDEELRFLPEE